MSEQAAQDETAARETEWFCLVCETYDRLYNSICPVCWKDYLRMIGEWTEADDVRQGEAAVA